MKIFLRIFLIALLAGGAACTEIINDEPPVNPFDIDPPAPPMPVPPPDSNSLVGLHTYIFSQSCSVPGCHDGSFEPDFRTVQSTYSTLVYHPVIKNTPQGTYEHRVVPNDVSASWLHNRVTTDDQTLGRMPLYDSPLTPGQVRSIEDWINNGAPDMFGNVSARTNTQPQFGGVAAFIDAFGVEYRVDTIRDNTFSPFGTLNNVPLTIWLAVADDSTQIGNLKDSKLAFSSNPFDFTGATEVSAQYDPNPKIVPDFFGAGNDGVFYWKVEVNTGSFQPNAVTFFRYYVEDGDHSEPLEFPKDDQAVALMLYMSFVVVQ